MSLDKIAALFAAVAVFIAGIASFIKNMATIHQTYGSIGNWIKNRKAIRAETKAEAARRNKQLDDLTASMQTVSDNVAALQDGQDKSKAVDKLLIRGRIIEMSDRILRRGAEYSDEIDDLNELYDTYKELGGNGAIDSRIKRVRQLQVKYRTEPWEFTTTENVKE